MEIILAGVSAYAILISVAWWRAYRSFQLTAGALHGIIERLDEETLASLGITYIGGKDE